MSFADFLTIAQIVSIAVFAYLALREAKPKQKVQESTHDANVSDAVDNLASALGLTTKQLVDSVANAALLQGKIQALEKQLDDEQEATKKRRQETDKHIADLENQIANVKREYEVEAQMLRNENATLRKRVIEVEDQYKDVTDNYSNSKRVIEILIKAMNDANIALPDLTNGDVSETIKGWFSQKPS